MSRLPRITGREVVAALRRAGFDVARVKGSHHFLRHADGRRTVVPVHSGETIGPGLLAAILRDCDQATEQLASALTDIITSGVLDVAPRLVNESVLPAYQRAEVRDALERHLRYEPTRVSKSRIKQLRGLSQPQYRLRVGEVRAFYGVTPEVVQVLAIVTKAEAAAWLAEHGRPMRRVALAEVKDDLSRFLRLAESEEILITRHGKPAGVLIGFETEEDWVDYRLEHHPEFLRRVAAARKAFDEGRGVRLEDVPGS